MKNLLAYLFCSVLLTVTAMAGGFGGSSGPNYTVAYVGGYAGTASFGVSGTAEFVSPTNVHGIQGGTVAGSPNWYVNGNGYASFQGFDSNTDLTTRTIYFTGNGNYQLAWDGSGNFYVYNAGTNTLEVTSGGTITSGTGQFWNSISGGITVQGGATPGSPMWSIDNGGTAQFANGCFKFWSPSNSPEIDFYPPGGGGGRELVIGYGTRALFYSDVCGLGMYLYPGGISFGNNPYTYPNAVEFNSDGSCLFTGSVTVGTLTVSGTSVPSVSASAGKVGTVAFDANYIYVCTGTNTWKRAALSTW